MTPQSSRRIFAVDVHATYIGYVVIEDAKRLLDWGLLHFNRAQLPATARAALRAPEAVARYPVGVMVLTEPQNRKLAQIGIALVREALVNAARQAGVQVVEITRREFLDALEVGTHYGAAQKMSQRFPDLAPRMPPRRKPWQTQRPTAAIFNAAAAGTAYLLSIRRRRAA